jgi:hypothetical protein
LERRQFFEFGGILLHTQIEGVGKHAPVILRRALFAAILAIADAVQARRIDHGKGFQHDGVNE